VPLPEKPRVAFHGPALTETPIPTGAIGANNMASSLCQQVNPGLPLMLPATFMNAARAAQPDFLTARMGKISRQLAQVEGGMPHALDDVVVWVRQCFLPLVIASYACNTQISEHPVWFAKL